MTDGRNSIDRLRVRLFHHPDATDWVQRWRDRFELVEASVPPEAEFGQLWAAPDHLELRFGSARGSGAWVTGQEVRRRAHQATELLRACAVRPGTRVLDAMSGWGLDGVVLAAAGARVAMVEREPLVQALQEDLLRRLGLPDVESWLGDGFLHLVSEPAWDVVYLDPMFPERNKRALPGKRMQYLARLLGTPATGRPLDQWIDRAMHCARDRVVVKRRARDPAWAEPDWQIRGRTIRYDVYRARTP